MGSGKKKEKKKLRSDKCCSLFFSSPRCKGRKVKSENCFRSSSSTGKRGRSGNGKLQREEEEEQLFFHPFLSLTHTHRKREVVCLRIWNGKQAVVAPELQYNTKGKKGGSSSYVGTEKNAGRGRQKMCHGGG